MDYKNTLNLPKTRFPMKANLIENEPKILAKWEREGLYDDIRRSRAVAKKFILHDGPPYPTGDLHLGTGINKILKDIIVRFYTMQGYDAPYVPGWDCHGLPIEHRVMQELGEEAFRMDKVEIRKRCKRYAEKFVKLQKTQFKGLGVLGDWERPYLTLSHEYEAGIIEVFGRLVEKGFVYRNKRPIHWCMSCRTALAEAELEYKEKTSPSIYVNFRLIEDTSKIWNAFKEKSPTFKINPEDYIYVLIWTTTPWTLPANLAVAVHPDFEYTALRYKHPENQKTYISIMANSLVNETMGKLNIKGFERLGTISGKALEWFAYKQVFDNKDCKVILADYVSNEEGTGCVHTAPGHGQEDYISGLKYKLPIFSPVSERGIFTKEASLFEGMHVFDANKAIIKRLDDAGLLLYSNEVTHSYPHCWRCLEPVIFRATEQWFVNIDNNNLRENTLEEIKKIRWVPAWGEERIAGMIRNRPDWCISRQRSWGVPIPAFYCKRCKTALLNPDVINSVRDVFKESGADSWFYKDASEFLANGIRCEQCGNTGFEKEMDIFDVWFESGSSHHAVLNKRDELSYPADIYLEGSDQHRGWFQLSILPSVGAWGCAPSRTIITHGFVVDEKGEKMSKSRGNFISVNDALKKFGADIIRLYTSSMDYKMEMNTSFDLINKISDVYRKIRNTFRYLLGSLDDFNPDENAIEYKKMLELDRWALHKTQELISSVTSAIESFEFHRVYYLIHNFCSVDMSAFYLDISKDRLYTAYKDALERRSAQTAFQQILLTLVRLIAPITVFTSEEVWAEINHKDEKVNSIHLAKWPTVVKDWLDYELSKRWEKIIQVRTETARVLERLRASRLIGNSLEAKVDIFTNDESLYNLLEKYLNDLPMIFIVSEVNLKNEKPSSAFQGHLIKELWIKADISENKKCERCWNYRDSVGKDQDYQTLCKKCIEVITHFN